MQLCRGRKVPDFSRSLDHINLLLPFAVCGKRSDICRFSSLPWSSARRPWQSCHFLFRRRIPKPKSARARLWKRNSARCRRKSRPHRPKHPANQRKRQHNPRLRNKRRLLFSPHLTNLRLRQWLKRRHLRRRRVAPPRKAIELQPKKRIANPKLSRSQSPLLDAPLSPPLTAWTVRRFQSRLTSNSASPRYSSSIRLIN